MEVCGKYLANLATKCQKISLDGDLWKHMGEEKQHLSMMDFPLPISWYFPLPTQALGIVGKSRHLLLVNSI